MEHLKSSPLASPYVASPPFNKYASVILDLALDKLLDYGVPDSMLLVARRGVRVEVLVRGHVRSGFIFEIKESSSFPLVQPIKRIVQEEALITKELFELALWLSRYYIAPLHQVIKILLPASIRKPVTLKEQLFVMRNLSRDEISAHCVAVREKFPAQAAILEVMLLTKKGMLLTELLTKASASRSSVQTLVKKGMLKTDIIRIDRSPLENEEYFKSKPKCLNTEQALSLACIVKSIEANTFAAHLLHGITGSGKTEVYLQAIDYALKLNRGAIILVPEISLTAQTIERFRSRFEGKIAVLHHRLSQGERLDEWERIRKGEARIVIGARSAVFSPIVNLGLIIVDEEHEGSYKQSEEGPCYHARDVAVMRGKLEKAAVILGSATPSLESFYNASIGKYTLSSLSVRAEEAVLPSFKIVDMRKEYLKAKGFTNFSEVLLDGIQKRARVGEQTILFLNRRGYHTSLLCPSCSQTIKCLHCDLALALHKEENFLSCHLCGFSISPPPKICPSCKAGEPLKCKGVGTELIEKSLKAIFPELRLARMDADTTKHKGSHQKILRDFGSGKADVLIGTQMIAKGLHFPQVTLVGILNCDSALNIPDFRSSETVFQLITQVAGRAGRGKVQGEVLIQTCLPENPTIQLAAFGDYEKFFKEEINVREHFRYPPFSQMVKLVLSGPDDKKTLFVANQLRNLIQKHLDSSYELHPVVPSGHQKVKDRFRYQFLIRGLKVAPLAQAIKQAREELALPKDIRLLLDVNPLSTYF